MMTTFKQAACCVGLVVVVTQTSLRQTPAVEVPGRFADLKPVPGLDLPYFQFMPSLTRDELTIVFSRWYSTTGDYDIYEATRASVDDPFDEPQRLAFNSDVVGHLTPWISGDGLSLYFHFDSDIHRSTRESRQDDWQPPVRLGPEINSQIEEFSPCVTDDELTMYFAVAYDLFQSTRGSKDEPFGPAEPLSGFAAPDIVEMTPRVSSDGLTLFYSSGPDFGSAELWIAERQDTNQPFDNPVRLNEFSLGNVINRNDSWETSPFITASWPDFGSKLYYVNGWSLSDGDIWEATWFPGYDFADRDLSGVDFRDTDLNDVSFRRSNIEGANFARASMDNVDLRQTEAMGASFVGAQVTDGNLSRANLANANLTGANLAGSDLAGANLMGATLQYAHLEALSFRATRYNQWTVFPDGFDPVSKRLRLVTSEAGDLDASGDLTSADLDLLAARLRDDQFMSWQFAMFDLNGDSAIDADDHRTWVLDLKNSVYGDADLNGEVGFADFVALSGKYGRAGGWASGDFDADGVVQFSDFVILTNNYGQIASYAAIPEPCGFMLGLGLIALATLKRRQH